MFPAWFSPDGHLFSKGLAMSLWLAIAPGVTPIGLHPMEWRRLCGPPPWGPQSG